MGCCRLPIAGQTRRYDANAAHGTETASLVKSRVIDPLKLATNQATGIGISVMLLVMPRGAERAG
jgi:hypothetical protein